MSRPVVEVLCFEDNPTDSFLVRQNLLESTVEQFVMTPAVRLRDGLKWIQEKPFDVILLDLGLPDSQGLDTFRKVYERAQGTPIVVLSGLADETVALKTLQEGSQDYLVKSDISAGVLPRAIRYAIERRRVRHELDRAHAENVLLLNSIPTFLIGVDKAGCIFRWNHLAQAIFGLTRQDVVGRPLQDCPIQWEWSEVSALISAIHQSEPAKAEIPFRTQDAKPGILAITLNSIRSENGEREGFMLIGSDVSERKSLEEQLRQAQKMESIGRLASGIAHEINSPTQFVSDNAHFIENSFSGLHRMLAKYGELFSAAQSGSLSPDRLAEITATAKEIRLELLLRETPEAIRELREGVERIQQIITSMKVFSHPGTKKQAVNINDAIQSTVIIARNEWKYSAKLITEFDTDLPPVSCYVGEFNQVILNLIVNAAHTIEDSRKQGKGKGIIKVSTHRNGAWAEVRVSDTGTGIPEEIRQKIFEPFFTTKEVGKGTGQGLALVYAVVVEKHSGSVELETEIGQGSTFTVRLPLEGETCGPVEVAQ